MRGGRGAGRPEPRPRVRRHAQVPPVRRHVDVRHRPFLLSAISPRRQSDLNAFLVDHAAHISRLFYLGFYRYLGLPGRSKAMLLLPLYGRVQMLFLPHASISFTLHGCVSAPPVGVRSTVINVSACMSVCLSLCLFVCPLAYLKNVTSKFHKVFCKCYLWLWFGPFLTAVRYVTYFRFLVNDVMFSHNA